MWPPHWPPQTAAARNAPANVKYMALLYELSVTFRLTVHRVHSQVQPRLCPVIQSDQFNTLIAVFH